MMMIYELKAQAKRTEKAQVCLSLPFSVLLPESLAQ